MPACRGTRDALEPRRPHERFYKDGRRIQVAERVTEDGHIVGIRTDITERKRMARPFAVAEDNPDCVRTFIVNRLLTSSSLLYRPRLCSATAKGRAMPALANWASTAKSKLVGPLRRRNHRVDEPSRDQAEEALRKSQERVNGIFDNSPSAIVLKDAEGRYILINNRFKKWFNLTSDEVIGKTAHEIFPKDFADQYAANDQEFIKSGIPNDTEITAPFADGREHCLTVARFPVSNSHGQIIGVGSIGSDITDQKIAEEQLRQAQKMEAVGQLTGGVAHDFNNLLTAISANLELISERTAADDRLQRMATAAIEAARRGGRLTQQLLAFSRQQALQPTQLNLNRLVRETDTLLQRTLGKDIETTVSADADLWHCVADATQVQNALRNLAINARHAMPDGGKLTIETANVGLGEDDVASYSDVTPGEYVMLSVTDTGTGMTPEVLEHVFDPFFTTKEVGQGSGLGLSMVQGFVKQSGGHVTIDSEVARGTTVRLYLPRVTKEDDSSVPSVTADEKRSVGETVLVVDDDAAVRSATALLFEDLGYRVLEASDGLSALAKLERIPNIDLLFTDVVMPRGLSGMDLAKEARQRYPELKTLFATGDAGREEEIEKSVGGRAFVLAKPFLKADLALAVRNAFEGR